MKGIKAFFRQNLGILVALVALCVLLAILPITRSSFVNSHNLFNVLRQVSTNMFIACGMTMVIILGGIDLSVGSIIALSGCVEAGMVVHLNRPLPIAVIIGIGATLSAGTVWDLADFLNVIMAFINMPVCMLIGGTAYKCLDDYRQKRKVSDKIHFHAKDIGLDPSTLDFWNE